MQDYMVKTVVDTCLCVFLINLCNILKDFEHSCKEYCSVYTPFGKLI